MTYRLFDDMAIGWNLAGQYCEIIHSFSKGNTPVSGSPHYKFLAINNIWNVVYIMYLHIPSFLRIVRSTCS